MVLRNEDQDAAQPADQVLPAWEAVASVQRNDQLPCWFVTQPDHARVSGVIAANFDRQRFPQLTDEIIKAIGLHDEGWEAFDGSSPEPRPVILAKGGRALPFIALPPDYYLRAWRSSIARAERLGPLAGLVVSRHFQALGRFGLARPELQPAAADQVKQFLEEELRRESRLMSPGDGTPEDVVRLSLAVLQFCDLLSLHLCSNAPHPVELPQEFGCGRVSLRRQGSRVMLSPSPLAGPVVIAFHAFLAESNRTVRRRRSVELQLS
ncbi:MAG: DUF3891 family protein [Candidatus Korobacteraceae bacterium]|jgi:hypothetical protein